MKGKLALIVGAATGYVLGARAGTRRYEQIKQQADKVLHNPKVQEKAAQAQELAKEKAPKLQEKASKAAQKATAGVKRKAQEASSDSNGSAATPSATPPVPPVPPEAATPADMPGQKSGEDSEHLETASAGRPTPSAPQSGGIGD